MNILIDIGHPAHVHYFRNFYFLMAERDHRLLITARDKEISHELLDGYGIPYTGRGKGRNSAAGKLLYLPKANILLLKEALSFKPDLFLSFSSPYAAQVSSLLRRPHIAFDDTEHARLGRMMYQPFTDVILSPACFRGEPLRKQIRFNSFMELLYLHPNYFTPDPGILEKAGLERGEVFSFLRFVSWNANHDIGMKGVSPENKRRVVEELSRFGKVLISSESALPPDLQKHQVRINPTQIHHLLHYAALVFGESATMASEAAMLGTPAVYIDNVGRGYTDELEKEHGLVFNFTESAGDQEKAIGKGVEILKSDPALLLQRRDRMLSQKIDVTDFLIRLVEEYPHSLERLRD